MKKLLEESLSNVFAAARESFNYVLVEPDEQ